MSMMVSRSRKAIAAFVTPMLALPLAGWISGEVPFSVSAAGAAIIAAITAVFTYYVPNQP